MSLKYFVYKKPKKKKKGGVGWIYMNSKLARHRFLNVINNIHILLREDHITEQETNIRYTLKSC